MITRFLKGIYNRHPPLPKYVGIWDLNIVLDLCKALTDNGKLKLTDIIQNLTMLLILLGVRRKQTLCSILIENIKITDTDLVLIPHVVQKYTRPGKSLKPILYKKCSHNSKLCVVQCMQKYLEKRRNLFSKDVKPLFITHGTPHKPATYDTISRCIKNELHKAGIDTDIYKPHSCRAAAVSKAKQIGILLQDIVNRGSWSSDSTFKKYYDKDIINIGEEERRKDFVSEILTQIQ